MRYEEIRSILEEMANKNYKEFIKDLISFEKKIDDEVVLDRMYNEYMENDGIGLLNDEFDTVFNENR